MVRAKIALLTLGNKGLATQEQARLWTRYRGYADLAERYSRFPDRFLLVMHGLSGSGKSWISQRLSEVLGLIRLRSDVERKRLFGLAVDDNSHSSIAGGIYTAEATAQTYQRLCQLTDQALAAGNAVVVDAACLREDERKALAEVAENQCAPCLIVSCEASIETLRVRVEHRARTGGDASEATLEVLDQQRAWCQPLTAEETRHTLHVDTAAADADQVLIDRLAERLRHPGIAGATPQA